MNEFLWENFTESMNDLHWKMIVRNTKLKRHLKRTKLAIHNVLYTNAYFKRQFNGKLIKLLFYELYDRDVTWWTTDLIEIRNTVTHTNKYVLYTNATSCHLTLVCGVVNVYVAFTARLCQWPEFTKVNSK